MKIKVTHKNGTTGFIQKNRRDPIFSNGAEIFSARRAKNWIIKHTASYHAMGWSVSIA